MPATTCTSPNLPPPLWPTEALNVIPLFRGIGSSHSEAGRSIIRAAAARSRPIDRRQSYARGRGRGSAEPNIQAALGRIGSARMPGHQQLQLTITTEGRPPQLHATRSEEHTSELQSP